MEATDEGLEMHEEIVNESKKQVPSDELTFPEQSWPKELKAWAEADFAGDVNTEAPVSPEQRPRPDAERRMKIEWCADVLESTTWATMKVSAAEKSESLACNIRAERSPPNQLLIVESPSLDPFLPPPTRHTLPPTRHTTSTVVRRNKITPPVETCPNAGAPCSSTSLSLQPDLGLFMGTGEAGEGGWETWRYSVENGVGGVVRSWKRRRVGGGVEKGVERWKGGGEEMEEGRVAWEEWNGWRGWGGSTKSLQSKRLSVFVPLTNVSELM